MAKQREQRNVATDTQQASPLKNDAQTRLQERQQVRDLLVKQRQELRNRNLSLRERRELIAKQRDELRNLRAEQTNRRLGTAAGSSNPARQQQAQQQTQQSSNEDRVRRSRRTSPGRGRFAAAYQNDPNWQARRAALDASAACRASGLAAGTPRRVRRLGRTGVLSVCLFRHFRIHVLALRL